VQSDSELIHLMCNGDRQAFADLYQRYKSAVYSYCMRMLSDKDAAEDAAHETFMKMYTNAVQLIDTASFLPWLFQIARNEVLMYLRRNKRNGQYDEETVWDELTPYEIAISSETTEIVQRILQDLKSQYREVVLLREYEGLSYAQIAEITGDSESSVKSRLYKARKAITEKLKTYYQ
jgi:RNA polymerase sigma-70 factor (ECF subfamily)